MPSPALVARLEWLATIGVDPKMPKAAFAVASVLASFPTAPGGELFPSNATLAKRAGITGRSVRDGLKRLKKGGYITVDLGGGRANTNVVHIIYTRKVASSFEDQNTRNAASSFENETRKISAINPENQRSETRKPHSADPGSEPGIEPDRPVAGAFDIDGWAKRAGRYGKGHEQRQAAIEKLRDAGATNDDMAEFFKSLPSPDTLGKAEGAKRFDEAVAAFISRNREPDEIIVWRSRVKAWNQKKFWTPVWGPAPDKPGTQVPISLRNGGVNGHA